jgi:predicted nucleic acid-binding protein
VIQFLDSSALVKRYVDEAGTQTVVEVTQQLGPLVASRLTWLEVTSAVARRGPGNALLLVDEVLRALDDDFANLIEIVELTYSVIAGARSHARRYGLRAGDAIQLASLGEAKMLYADVVRLISSDRKLLDCAVLEGFRTLDPSNE